MRNCIHKLSPLHFRPGYCVRLVHSTPSHHAFAPAASPALDSLASHEEIMTPKKFSNQSPPPLSILPLSTVLRTYLITSVSSSPTLINSTIAILLKLLDAKTPLADPDRNPVLKFLFKKSFYAQFCVGESKREVRENVGQLRQLGYEGVILESALEVMKPKDGVPSADSEVTKTEIAIWRRAMLDTIELANRGDCIGLKWSGLGTLAFHHLQNNLPPTPLMQSAIDEIANLASTKGVILLPSAEEEKTNHGIHAWTLSLQRKHNTTPGKATIFTTYQAYLKSTPATLSAHLALAQHHGYTAGVKLVRGAYLASEPRSAIWPTIEQTHATYDALADACLKREWNSVLRRPSSSPSANDNNSKIEDAAGPNTTSTSSFPEISVFLATHNAHSVDTAMKLRNEQAASNTPRPELAYAQLFGMADEVSTKILAVGREAALAGGKGVDVPRAFKCVCWGSTGQCLNYLLRRAAENKDAVSRTGETRRAMAGEVARRVRAWFGFV